MRYYKSYTLRISEDEVTNPKLNRFEQEDQVIEDPAVGGTALINILKVRRETFDTGSFVLSMENLTTARYMYIKADQPVTIDFNNDSLPKTLVANMESEFWMEFTAVTIETTTSTEITIAYGGV